MDYLNKFGPCTRCSCGLLKTPIVKPVFPSTSNYCSKCGMSLRWKCNDCNGTGKTFLIDNYCSECGKALDDTCTSCNGTGETENNFHICR